jgi:hypothetical protein
MSKPTIEREIDFSSLMEREFSDPGMKITLKTKQGSAFQTALIEHAIANKYHLSMDKGILVVSSKKASKKRKPKDAPKKSIDKKSKKKK